MWDRPAYAALAAVVALCFVLVVMRRRRLGSARRAELASRPKELAGAKLVYMEKQFRIRRPIALVARVDRAYLAADGAIVLVELKTRWQNQIYASDVIQLSAQKMAIEVHGGQRVAAFAFVTVQLPNQVAHRSHRVQLMATSEIEALFRRRESVAAGRIAPAYAPSTIACKSCAYREHCDRRA